jgi:hypothetical protein
VRGVEKSEPVWDEFLPAATVAAAA